MRKNICFCLALVVLLSSLSMLVGAVNFSSLIENTSELGVVEPKSFSTATLENDFADDRVLVVLNNKASLNFKEYSTSDFKEVKCAAVRDLSTGKKKQVEIKVNDFKNSVRTMSAESKAIAVEEINKYNQIICLELASKGKENVLEAIKALEARDDVVYAGPDYTMSPCAVIPNDTYRSQQWAISSIDLDDAWGLTTGSSNLYIGVLDSGIDAAHPDLQGRIATFLCADFNRAYVHTVPVDSSGHGTHVAGIIGATMNNNKGIAGAASGVKIAALRVIHSNKSAFFSMLIEALDYAEEMGLPILNLSAGVAREDGIHPEALEDAIENYSGLLVCAAGNEGYNNDDLIGAFYPASIELDNILAVGASTRSGERAYFSSYGVTSVDVFAPGDGILSCFPTAKCQDDTCESDLIFADTHRYEGYHSVSGTSMAAPYVTAIAALMLSKNPGLTPQQIKSIIIETCTDSTALTGKCVSGGVVNAYRAVLNA